MNKFIKTRNDVVIFIKQKVMICENGYIEIRDYKRCIGKLKPGYEAITKEENFKGRISSVDLINSDKAIRDDSLYRSRKILIDYVNENEKDFNTFITLTFEDNIMDISQANHKFNIFISSMKRAFSDFKYLGVPEFQKRGAVHYHLLTNLKVATDLCPLQNEKENMYDIKYWNYGYSSAFDLKNTDENFSVTAYMLKYLYKDLDNRLFGRTKILKSNNLRKPMMIEFEENNMKYTQMKNFINEKSIFLEEKDIIPKQPYAIPFTLTTCKTTNQNIKDLKMNYQRKEFENEK